MKCCRVKSGMLNQQMSCEFHAQNPLPQFPYTWPLLHIGRWTLVLCLLLFFNIVKATAVDATTTLPTRKWCWTSSDLPAESPKSRHHPQEVKDRTIPLLWFSAVTTAYTTSTLHTEIMIWNRKIALSRYNTALFYSVNVLHLHAGSLEPMVLGPISHQIPFPQTAQTGRGANSENI